jgi:D-glycero-beta-D-manno-heptose 1-phosphate adenylyltransferase
MDKISDVPTDKKVVFTNGCFDILHIGHVRLLNIAKSYGDILVVGVNSDNSVKRFKGEDRPVNGQDDRCELLNNLKSVDYVIVFDEDDPCRIISELKPNVHVKGGDYDPDNYDTMPESKVVRDLGGEVKIVPLIQGKSTTGIIDKVQK